MSTRPLEVVPSPEALAAGPEMLQGPSSAELFDNLDSTLGLLRERVTQLEALPNIVAELQARMDRMEANQAPVTAEAPSDASDSAGDVIPPSDPPADLPPSQRRGGGTPPPTPPTGGEGNGNNDPDRRKNFLKKAGAVLAVGIIAVGATLGIQKLANGEESKKGGDTPAQPTAPVKPAKGQVGPASKLGLSSAEYKRLAPVANNASVDTVGEAVKTYKGANYDQAVQDILSNPEAFRNVDISHFKNRYINSRAFAPEEISTQNALELKLIGIVQDEANAQSAANLIQGHGITAERNDSHAEQIELIRKFLLDDDTKINGNYRLNGVWGNGNVNQRTEELGVKDFNHNNRRAIRVTGANGAEWIWSLDSASESDEDMCNNDQERREQPKNPTPTPENPTPENPNPTPNPEPEPEPEEPGPGPKVDRTPGRPGGNDGQNGGSGTRPTGPTGPGVGPAGQTPRPDGGVGGEVLPAAPAPAPTPPPVEAAPAPPVTGPEVVGNPTTAPATPAAGSETPAPTAPVNGDDGPQG